MSAFVSTHIEGAVVTRRRRNLHVVLSDGQELVLTVELAAALVAALLADGDVHRTHLHGGGR